MEFLASLSDVDIRVGLSLRLLRLVSWTLALAAPVRAQR